MILLIIIARTPTPASVRTVAFGVQPRALGGVAVALVVAHAPDAAVRRPVVVAAVHALFVRAHVRLAQLAAPHAASGCTTLLYLLLRRAFVLLLLQNTPQEVEEVALLRARGRGFVAAARCDGRRAAKPVEVVLFALRSRAVLPAAVMETMGSTDGKNMNKKVASR